VGIIISEAADSEAMPDDDAMPDTAVSSACVLDTLGAENCCCGNAGGGWCCCCAEKSFKDGADGCWSSFFHTILLVQVIV
jgi:hypothetical protein